MHTLQAVKVREDVTPEKLRGGFYTPEPLVAHCYSRIRELTDESQIRLLEPSVGDGAFLRGLANSSDLRPRLAAVHGVELVPAEAEKARTALAVAGLPGTVDVASALAWASTTDEWFDAAVGNPPFVRYQFLSPADKASLPKLSERLKVPMPGVGNVWIPVFLGALGRLRPGGAFAFVIPTECFTGCSAGVVRKWLTTFAAELRFDLFPPQSFPGVLQEVTVLSGRRVAEADAPAAITVVEHSAGQAPRRWGYPLRTDDRTWMRYLLEPRHLGAVADALDLGTVHRLHEVAKLEVSIVTGANDFFCVDDATVAAYDLEAWIEPLLPRSRHALGLCYSGLDQDATREAGARCWFLNFDARRPDPKEHAGPARYLEQGKAAALHERYKCRIREPWYRVPSIRSGGLLLSKRSHLFPRLILNEARSLTTDTIYRGEMRSDTEISKAALVASFHNSLTLLTAELEGRSFGGGVLELVPSEVGRLSVAAVAGFERHLPMLDRVARTQDPEELVRQTDASLVKGGLLPMDLIGLLADARETLLTRRLDRNRVAPAPAMVA